ncbi:MAG: ATP phosphoribosyltransferase regulatory subunit [Mariprofundaceae bacterium]|nr:ATP phosphoribosyltransferase regulatory subunit [Mariprofundaceae bacterium]
MTDRVTDRPIIGLDDAFGFRAKALRDLQRRLLALFEEAGFDEVIPPILERPDTLKSGAGRFLADQTVVFSDPAGAGLLAIRSDITPQIARIAATRLQSKDILKLCYSGTVMLARPESRRGSRQQWQTGVEYLGVSGAAGDTEVMRLAATCMLAAGFKQPVLQVGHIGLLKALVEESSISLEMWRELIARRSPDDLAASLASEKLSKTNRNVLLAIASGLGDLAWIKAQQGKVNNAFDCAAEELTCLTNQVSKQVGGGVQVQADAAVMPRFLYHSGIVFAGFAAGVPQALLHGGRYDAMMAAHGRDMPATGFSCDLWTWLDAVQSA